MSFLSQREEGGRERERERERKREIERKRKREREKCTGFISRIPTTRCIRSIY